MPLNLIIAENIAIIRKIRIVCPRPRMGGKLERRQEEMLVYGMIYFISTGR